METGKYPESYKPASMAHTVVNKRDHVSNKVEGEDL